MGNDMSNKQKITWCNLEVITAVVVILIIAGAFMILLHDRKVSLPNSYKAWVKQTGNPKELTFSEWKALLRSREPELIIIPVP